MSVTHSRLTKFKKVKWLFGKRIEIPKEWTIHRLGEIGDLGAGGTPSTFNQKFWKNGTMPWITSSEVKNNKIASSEKKITELGLQNSAARIFPKDTVLIAITGFGTTRGRSALLKIDATTNQSIVGIQPNPQIINSEFLWYFLQKMYWIVRNLAQGTQQPGLNLDILEKFQIYYPISLLEQQKIASILSRVDATIEATQKTIETIERLKKGLVQQLLTRGIDHNKFKKVKILFNKEIKIPETWKTTIFDLVVKINPESINDQNISESILYIDIGAIHNFKIIKYTSHDFDSRPSRAQRIARKNDVIVSMVRPYLQGFSKINTEYSNLVCSTGFAVIRTKSESDAELIFQHVQSWLFNAYVLSRMEGLAYPAITSVVVSKAPILYPTNHDERVKIASILSGVDAMQAC